MNVPYYIPWHLLDLTKNEIRHEKLLILTSKGSIRAIFYCDKTIKAICRKKLTFVKNGANFDVYYLQPMPKPKQIFVPIASDTPVLIYGLKIKFTLPRSLLYIACSPPSKATRLAPFVFRIEQKNIHIYDFKNGEEATIFKPRQLSTEFSFAK